MNSYFEIQPLDYMLYMFLTCMLIFILIGCNLSFDLWTHLLCIILMGRNFIHFWERERERERERVQKAEILEFRIPFWSWKSYHFFLWVQLFRNKDRHFLYRMYIKEFFFRLQTKCSFKEYKVLYVYVFLFIFLWILK